MVEVDAEWVLLHAEAEGLETHAQQTADDDVVEEAKEP